MEIFHAVILGIVEGLTEFLPISSTGHLVLASDILGLTPDKFLTTFEVAIQVGAILAVLFLYWKQLLFNLENIKKIINLSKFINYDYLKII